MGRRDFFEQEKKRKMVTTFAIAVGLSIVACVTIFVMYSKKLNDEAEANLFALTQTEENIVSNEELEEASYSEDKGVQNVNYENTVEVELDTDNTVDNTIKTPESKEPVPSVVKEEENVTKEEKTEETPKPTEEKVENTEEPVFQAPIAGDITKDFAMDTLVYSETLDEWCTHSGIDIKADKASVVMAAEKGKVESIKNDPRYGLTVIITHSSGFKSVYSNLLTTEFVKEGEEVEKGQTIATVGETASFEVADDCHLHFEMYKDGQAVNPTIYFK